MIKDFELGRVFWINQVGLTYTLSRGYKLEEGGSRDFPVALWVKDPVLSLLWRRVDPWPQNIHVTWPKKKSEREAADLRAEGEETMEAETGARGPRARQSQQTLEARQS